MNHDDHNGRGAVNTYGRLLSNISSDGQLLEDSLRSL